MSATLEQPSVISHEGQQFLTQDRAAFLQHLALAKPIAAPPAPVHPAGLTPPPVSVSLAQYQTPIKNQGDRGTCWAFAGVAAVEAAYKRKYGVTLDLSEQYVFHLPKVQEMVYDTMAATRTHENNSTLWGFQGASDILLKLQISSVCLEGAAPYMQQAGLQAVQATVANGSTINDAASNPLQSVMDDFELREALIPSAARAQCKYLVTGVGTPAGNDAASLEAVLAAGKEIVVDLVLDYTTDANGVWQYNNQSTGGGHNLLLIGYDRNAQYFLAKNSWGGTAYYKLGYSFINHCVLGAHYVTDVRDPNVGFDLRAYWMGTWNMDHDGWRGTLNIRRHVDYRAQDGQPFRLGSYTRDGATYDVNGHFENNFSHLVMFIAPSSARVTPGQEVGQRFDFYCFTRDIRYAAGRTTWSNYVYGAVLSRPGLPAETAAAFQVNDWLGTYAMNYDGWQGTLKVTSVSPLVASYTDGSGKVSAVQGTISDHEMSVTMYFPNNPQKFDLLYHTRERGVFSGTTVWNGETFGALGFQKS